MVSGTPSAVPESAPKLSVMSPRTTPLWVRICGPFEPSPGYGPAVSSGIFEQVVVSVLPAPAPAVAAPLAPSVAPAVPAAPAPPFALSLVLEQPKTGSKLAL